MAAATAESRNEGATERWERWARPDRSAQDPRKDPALERYREAADDGAEDYYEDHKSVPGRSDEPREREEAEGEELTSSPFR
uniref:Uncharacterized protein n=1 Tax=Knipowitschia caucasica TaxID=637954 RepID=A0AAV2K2A8_KNICA